MSRIIKLPMFIFILAFLACTPSFCQDVPSIGLLDGPGMRPGGTAYGDTIIRTNLPINGKFAPSRNPNPVAIFYHNYIGIFSSQDVSCTYAIRTEEDYYVQRGQLMLQSDVPTLIELISLPPGYYTLRLYINNECLEGEFEKE